MAKKRRKPRRSSPGGGRSTARGATAPSTPATVRDRIVLLFLALVLAASALLVDPKAHASFDAPKRLVVLFGAALATIAAFAVPEGSQSPVRRWRTLPQPARIALGATAAALVWAVLSALFSPRRPVSLDALRAIVLFGLLLPLGASLAAGRRRAALLGIFLAATGVNATISIAQSRGLAPFRLLTYGTRNETGALAGNVGYLATILSFAAVAALGIALAGRTSAVRRVAWAMLVLFAAALLVNRNLTAFLSTAAGAIALVLVLRGKRALLPIAALFAALIVGAFAYPASRDRVFEAVRAARAGDWDRLTTYRGGPWLAAIEMARDRPVFGFGPGTFPAEFSPHRLQGEMRMKRRFVNPIVTSSYSEAHSEYLQAFAETGIPGGVAVLVAVGALIVGVRRRVGTEARALEPALLFGVLVTGAVTALTWFPLQRAISAAPLLLAAGRAWRISSERVAGEPL